MINEEGEKNQTWERSKKLNKLAKVINTILQWKRYINFLFILSVLVNSFIGRVYTQKK